MTNTLGDLFRMSDEGDDLSGYENPPQAPAPTPPLTQSSWADYLPGGARSQQIANMLTGIGGALRGDVGLGSRIQFAEQEAAQRQQYQQQQAQIQKSQAGIRLVQGLSSLLDIPPNVAGPAWESFAASQGFDPKDENIKRLGKVFDKLDPEQRQIFKGFLAQQGIENPDGVVDAVGEMTRNPATMMQLFQQIGEYQGQQQAQRILSGEGTLKDFVDQKVKEESKAQSAEQPQQPTALQGLQSQLEILDKQAKLIMQRVKDPKARQQALAIISQREGNIRSRLGHLQSAAQFQQNQQRLEAQARESLAFRETVHADLQAQRAQSNQLAAAMAAMNSPGARRAANLEAQQDTPLDAAATRWIDPETLHTASPDMTPREAKDAGLAVVTPSLSAAIPSARTALQVLKRYRELADKLLPDVSGMNSTQAALKIAQNRAKLLAKQAARDPDVMEFMSLRSTLPAQVKAFGDTANIAVKEREFAEEAVPWLSDSKQSARRKVDSREGLLKQVIRSSISTASRKARAQERSAQPVSELSDEELLKRLNQ